MDNKVFFQHPDLMRALCVHETVMQLMVNTLNKAQQQQQSANSAMAELISSQQGRRGSFIPSGTLDSLVEHTKVPPPHPTHPIPKEFTNHLVFLLPLKNRWNIRLNCYV